MFVYVDLHGLYTFQSFMNKKRKLYQKLRLIKAFMFNQYNRKMWLCKLSEDIMEAKFTPLPKNHRLSQNTLKHIFHLARREFFKAKIGTCIESCNLSCKQSADIVCHNFITKLFLFLQNLYFIVGYADYLHQK